MIPERAPEAGERTRDDTAARRPGEDPAVIPQARLEAERRRRELSNQTARQRLRTQVGDEQSASSGPDNAEAEQSAEEARTNPPFDADVAAMLGAQGYFYQNWRTVLGNEASRQARARTNALRDNDVLQRVDPSAQTLLRASTRAARERSYTLGLYDRTIAALERMKQEAARQSSSQLSALRSSANISQRRMRRIERYVSAGTADIDQRLQALTALRTELQSEVPDTSGIRERDEAVRMTLLQRGVTAEDIDRMIRDHVTGTRRMDTALIESHNIQDHRTLSLVQRLPTRTGRFFGRAAPEASLDVPVQTAIDYEVDRLLQATVANAPTITDRLSSLAKLPVGSPVRIYNSTGEYFSLGTVQVQGNIIALQGRGRTATIDTAARSIRMNDGSPRRLDIEPLLSRDGSVLPGIALHIPSFRMAGRIGEPRQQRRGRSQSRERTRAA